MFALRPLTTAALLAAGMMATTTCQAQHPSSPGRCPEACILHEDHGPPLPPIGRGGLWARLKALLPWSGPARQEVPPIPWQSGHSAPEERGMLLKTGAIQLGPGVGKDLMGSLWDGRSGF